MRRLMAMALTLMLLFGTVTPSFAEEKEEPSAGEIFFDVLLIRPLSLASIVLGTGVFIAGLPFTVPTGGVGIAAEKLVLDPIKFTFTRPVGETFEY